MIIRRRGYTRGIGGNWIMHPGWYWPDRPCRKGHNSPRNQAKQCVQCNKEYRASRGHFAESTRRWNQQNRPRLAELRVEYNARYPERRMLRAAKNASKVKSLPYNLTVDDINIPEVCPILGIPLIKQFVKRNGSSPSLDRIVPELGYVKGNVMVISWRANFLKSDASIDEMEQLAQFYRSR